MSDLTALNLKPGEVVGGYTLISRLGSGAMGSVWRVRDDGGQIYAMKILRDSLADDASAESGDPDSAGSRHPMQDPNLKENVTPRERLRREALALRKVNHPGVCGIVDMELDDALAFIVTELIEGRNLKDDVAANGRYVGDDLERLARKLIEAVRAVHAAGIIHRDIKPTNVMVSASGPVLVDFGIAMGEGESHVTRTGLVMGTPGFIAPEIIDGAESSEATDWWSTASVLAFAAMGEPVFGTKPMMAVLEREASGNANLAGLPAHTLAAFRSALNPDPAKRCTPDQLLHAIALDALTPFTGDFDDTPAVGLAKHADATGVMHPFDAASDGGTDYGADGRTVSLAGADPTGATAVLPDLPSGTAALPATSVLPPATPLSAPVTSARDAWRDGDVSGVHDATRALRPDQCTVALPSDLLDAADATAVLDADGRPGATAVMPTRTRVMPLGSVPAATSGGFHDVRSVDGRFDDDAADEDDAEGSDAENADAETTGGTSMESNSAASPLRRLADASNGEGIGFTDMPPAYVPYRPPKDDDAKPADAADGSPATAAIAPRANTVGSRPSGSNAGSAGIGRPHTGVGAGDAMAATAPATGGTVPEFLRDAQRQRMPQTAQTSQSAQTSPSAPARMAAPQPAGSRTAVMPPVAGAPVMAAGNAPAAGVYGQPVRQPWPGQPSAGQRFPGQPYGAQPGLRPMAASPETMAMRQPMPGRSMPGAMTGMTPGMPQQPQQPPNPAVDARARYLIRGRGPLSALTVVPAVAALLTPAAGPIAAAVIFWVLLTVGCSTDAQLLREERRGGERKSSDAALRAVQLPWHILKALGMTSARMLLFLLIDIAGMTALTVTLNLPVTTIPTPNGLWPYQIPWPADGLLSPTGAALALAAGGAWLVTAFWPFAVTLRLGAGATRGNPPMA